MNRKVASGWVVTFVLCVLTAGLVVGVTTRAAVTTPQPGAASVAASQASSAKAPGIPKLLPREEEVAAALSAGPANMAEEAGVYALEASGYVKVRESKNGFTCIVTRDTVNTFEPQCMDAEGTATVLPRILFAAEQRVQGKSDAEIDVLVAEGYRTGKFRAPRRPGVNYMLSTKNVVVMNPRTGETGHYQPHLMFYAPYLTNKDLGVKPGPGVKLFVISEGTPRAYIIVPVGEGKH